MLPVWMAGKSTLVKVRRFWLIHRRRASPLNGLDHQISVVTFDIAFGFEISIVCEANARLKFAGLGDLQAFRDAAQQGTVVTRMKKRNNEAAADIKALFTELLGANLKIKAKVGNG